MQNVNNVYFEYCVHVAPNILGTNVQCTCTCVFCDFHDLITDQKIHVLYIIFEKNCKLIVEASKI